MKSSLEMKIKLNGEINAGELKKSIEVLTSIQKTVHILDSDSMTDKVLQDVLESFTILYGDSDFENDDDSIIIADPALISRYYRNVCKYKNALIERGTVPGEYVIKAGSIVITVNASSIPLVVKQKRAQLFANGDIDLATGKVLKDIVASSASTACGIVSGQSVNGKTYLKRILWP